jgi:hypothetical protein
MEMIQVGPTRVMVPKDSRIYKRNNVLFLEPTLDYVTRKLVAVEERLANIEATQQELSEKLEALSKIVSKKDKGSKGDVPLGDVPPGDTSPGKASLP